MKIKNNINKFGKNLKKQISEFKSNPKEKIKGINSKIVKYYKSNKYFCIYILINFLNAFLLRVFTIGGINTVFAISPILADLAVIILLGAIGYLMKERRQVVYYVILSFILTLLCTINSSYYTFYTSFASISLLSTTKFIFAVGDAVVENVIKIRDIIYFILFFIMIVMYVHISKKNKLKEANSYKKAYKTSIVGIVFVVLFWYKYIDEDKVL